MATHLWYYGNPVVRIPLCPFYPSYGRKFQHWSILMIYPRAWWRLERRHGFLTAVMCFASVIDGHTPLGAGVDNV